MTDAELIARLQNSKGWPTLGNAAADRIEALIAERDEYHSEAMTYIEKWGAARKAQDEAEAKLAKAHKDGSQLAAWQCLFDDGKTGIVCDDWGNQYCAMQRRAERAEAALAAPEVMHEDAPAAIIGEIGNQIHNLGCELQNDEDASLRLSDLACRLWDAAKLFPTEPTALDRMLAEAREKALLEAVGVLRKWHDNLILCEFKEEPRTVGAAVDAILALIEKPNAR